MARGLGVAPTQRKMLRGSGKSSQLAEVEGSAIRVTPTPEASCNSPNVAVRVSVLLSQASAATSLSVGSRPCKSMRHLSCLSPARGRKKRPHDNR